MSLAEVVFNLPINHAYTYRIPAEVTNLKPGMRVLAPLGKQTITGVVVGLPEKTKLTSLKTILDVLDEKPLLSEDMLRFTRWIAEYYFSSWGQTIQLAIAKGIDSEEKEFIHLAEVEPDTDLTERQRELYLIIGSNPGNSKEFYHRKFGYDSFYYFLARLEEKGFIRRERQRIDARVKELQRKFVHIPADYPIIKETVEDYLKYLKRRPEVDQFMLDHLNQDILMSDFLKQTEMSSGTLQKMSRFRLCAILEKQYERTPAFEFSEKLKSIILTDEQQIAVKTMIAALHQDTFSTFLLHGVTGSGKTQVYIEVLKEVLKKGKTAIILIPEIALTPQTVTRFQTIFSEKIAVLHSKMSQGERFDAWMACYEGHVRIVVGPRSALFVPLKDIGLIVVDEEHETTYKQSETAPRYNARDAAIYWAKLNNALAILGSATPSLESYYNARREKYRMLEIRNRVDHQSLPDVYVVDMKTKRARIEQKFTLFSEILLQKIKERLQRNEQVILLQNRRGYSSFLQCHDCGFIPGCPNCDITLTYHSFDEKLHCHFCGHEQPAFSDCPACGEKQIVYKGVGTQRIESELQSIIPQVRILRMDQDTTRGKNRHDAILKAFGEHEADILLGTQMIAKGLDFENVTLVGVISADVGLALPDFRSPERVFQLLTQVAGRSGRSAKGGEVVVQSYMFSHYSIQFARYHDFSGFYMQEVQHRRSFNYPPFIKLIQILISAVKMSDAISTARQIALNINRRAKNYCQVIGPSPAVIPRMNNLFRWQVFLKLNPTTDPGGGKTKELLWKILEPWLARKNKEVRVVVDVDPLVMV